MMNTNINVETFSFICPECRTLITAHSQEELDRKIKAHLADER